MNTHASASVVDKDSEVDGSDDNRHIISSNSSNYSNSSSRHHHSKSKNSKSRHSADRVSTLLTHSASRQAPAGAEESILQQLMSTRYELQKARLRLDILEMVQVWK